MRQRIIWPLGDRYRCSGEEWWGSHAGLCRVGQVIGPCHSVCQNLTFSLANSPPLRARPNHKTGRENIGLVATNVKTSDKAQKTNSSGFLLEQDPHGHCSLNFSAHTWRPYSRSCCRIYSYARSDPFSRTFASSPWTLEHWVQPSGLPGIAFLFS